MSLKNVYVAKTLDEVLNLLNQYGCESKLIAGGTDVIIQLREKEISPKVLVDISNLSEINFIDESEDKITIGACTTFTTIAESSILKDKLKGLVQSAESVGSPQIRNAATIGGNICNASMAADIVPPLLALDAEVLIESKAGKRRILLDHFLMGKGKVDIKPEEIVTAITFNKPKNREALGFGKLGLRKALAIARISTAIYLSLDEENTCRKIRIANGAVGFRGMREKEVENIFIGKQLTEDVINMGIEKLREELNQRLAGRSSAEFKTTAIAGIFKKALLETANNCKE